MVTLSEKITYCFRILICDTHCMKSVHIRSFSGPYFPSFRLITNHKNSGFLLRCDCVPTYSILAQCSISIQHENVQSLSDVFGGIEMKLGLKWDNDRSYEGYERDKTQLFKELEQFKIFIKYKKCCC